MTEGHDRVAGEGIKSGVKHWAVLPRWAERMLTGV